MQWQEFVKVRELLMIVNTKILNKAAYDANSLKARPKSLAWVSGLIPVFRILTEQTFKDLTYRYIVSDKELRKIQTKLLNFDL